ncbi:MAG: hypothetical protein U0136_01495 [Bdellovibrionota bacterium]
MTTFSQSDFDTFVIESGVIGFFDKPVTLKSGRQSHFYANWRKVSNDVFLIDQLATFLLEFIHGLESSGRIEHPDTIYGVPEGATKVGIIAQYKYGKASGKLAPGSHTLSMGRGSPKEHGAPEDRYFVGAPMGKTIIVEDVTTTGGSLLTTIDTLIASDTPVVAAIGLTNRMEKRDDGKSVADAIAEKRSSFGPIRYYQMSSALELLPKIAARNPIRPEIRDAIESEFKKYGVAELKL